MINQISRFVKKSKEGILLGGLAGLLLIFLAGVVESGVQATLILLGIVLGLILQKLSKTQNLKFLKNRLLFFISVGVLIIIAINIFIPGTIFSFAGALGTILGGLFGAGGAGVFGLLTKGILIPIVLIGIGLLLVAGGISAPIGIILIVAGLALLGLSVFALGSLIITIVTNFKLILILAAILLALWISFKGRGK